MDGAGKSTQVEILYEKLKEAGQKLCFITREPGGTRIGQKIRQLLLDPENEEMAPEAELFLYMASRAQLVSQEIVPRLKEGYIVITDRFLLSSLVYQGLATGIEVEKVKLLGKIATRGLEPDKIYVLNVSLVEGLSRFPRQQKLWDRIELRGEEFHRKIQQAYLKAAEEYPQAVIINGNLSKEEVHLQIWEDLKNVL